MRGEIGNFTGRGEGEGGDFFIEWREPEQEWFWQLELFAKLKTAFCKCWPSVKTKINMTNVSKEHEIKAKKKQEQWLKLKMLFLLGYNLRIVA